MHRRAARISLISHPTEQLNKGFDKAHEIARNLLLPPRLPPSFTLPPTTPSALIGGSFKLVSSFTSPLLGIARPGSVVGHVIALPARTAESTNENVLNIDAQPFGGKGQPPHHDEHHQSDLVTNGDAFKFLFASRPHAHPDRRWSMGNKSIYFIPTRLFPSA